MFDLDIGEKLQEAILPHTVFQFTVLGYNIPVTDTVIVMWIVMTFLIAFSLFLTAKGFEAIPKGRQHIAELIVDFFNNLAKNNIGHHWIHFAPYLGTVGLFLIFSDIISIFNMFPTSEDLYNLTHIGFFKHLPAIHLKPPTRNINVTAALALMSIVMVVWAGIKVKGLAGWLRSFLYPMPIFLPFKILDHFIRPTSLALRLFGNILGAFIVMELLYFTLPAVLPAAMSIYFDLFDGILQAYIFVFLTSFYIAEAVE